MKSPRELGLPYADWRPGQRLAIRSIQYAKTEHVVVNAPTGAGKSTLAAALPRLDPDKRHVTLTATKALQGQYSSWFPFLDDLQGMSNYPCRAAKDQFKRYFPNRRGTIMCDEGPCQSGLTCELKESGCDYFDARRTFVSSPSGLSNYAAWLSNRKWGGAQILGDVDRLVCDEAHALPEQLMSAFAIDVPMHLIDSRRTPTTIRQWRQWATEKIAQLAPASDDDTRLKRERTERNLRQLATMDRSWAWDQHGEHGFHFEPTVPRLLRSLLFTEGGTGQIVYLSATITPATLELLDIDEDDITFESIRSHFPVETRPVYVVPGARVDYRSMKDRMVVNRWMDAIDDICDARDDRRGLIHCVSFERGWNIYSSSYHKRRMILHEKGESATSAVQRFRAAGPIAILISPSITTGFDFPYKDAEFQIICKLPFPDTRSPIMRARIKATHRYRDHYTMTTLIQACGRINRAEDDQGETFIIDEHFKWWYPNNDDLASPWFDDAIIRTRKRIVPLPRLAA